MRGSGNPRMYRGLTVNTPGCVAFSHSCSAGDFKLRRFQRFPASPSGQRSARPKGGAVPGPSGVRFPGYFNSRDGLEWRHGPDIRSPRGIEGNFRRTRFGAKPWPSATNKGGIAVAIVFQTGRRLMRQTVLPTKTREVSAAARNDSSARRVQSRSSGSAWRPGPGSGRRWRR